MIDKPRVYRSRVLIVAGCLLAAVPLGIWVLWLVYTGGSAGSLICPLVVSWIPFLAWFGLIRPRLIAGPTGVTVVQPLRTTTVPWTEIRGFDSLEVLYVHRCDGLPSVRVPALATSNVSRVAGKLGHADRVARDLNVMLAQYRGGRAPRTTAESAAGRKGLRLTPWHSAYPAAGILALGGSRLDQPWLGVVGLVLAVVATVALRGRNGRR
ncbi:PH domain-containing protein [Planosporangium mesophilum]|uniref:Low molecular weight protein antigen 6 PH domain-containing protein n=1 Tax=Planosporangium mesophilum TaxID=689768 RepID=A0A8J3TCB3_9ACTN|nr:PH domain-containing protein [Planosporangium mesophilum]NJC85406.1 PH domain-containing protein [Planosporangium mesophilum]GII24083.1 hypothetical protein Pme01_36800 [Planosporangium mesophilum]